jgi:hypothetical protein
MWRQRADNGRAEHPSALDSKLEIFRELTDRMSLAPGEISLEYQSALCDQWRNAVVSIASQIADHTDQYLDPRREDPEWQTLLSRIFEVIGAEELHPGRNDPFDEIEHHVVGQLPMRSPEDLRDRVAHLRRRGFRFGGRVLRKAVVVVYH